jgi:hypothetical protein
MRAIVHRLLFVVLLVAMVGATGMARATTTQDQGAGQDMKDAGHSTKKAAKKTAHKTKKGAKKGTNKAAQKTSEGADKVQDKTSPQ